MKMKNWKLPQKGGLSMWNQYWKPVFKNKNQERKYQPLAPYLISAKRNQEVKNSEAWEGKQICRSIPASRHSSKYL